MAISDARLANLCYLLLFPGLMKKLKLFTYAVVFVLGCMLCGGPVAHADVIYVGNFGYGTNGYTIAQFNSSGEGSVFAHLAGNFLTTGLALDGSGDLYAANWIDGTIHKFDANGNDSLFATTTIHSIHGLALDHNGNLYAADFTGGRILKFNPNGQMSEFASNNVPNPTGLVFDGSGNLYVSLYGGTVDKFNPNGTPSVFATSLSEPYGLAFDAAGNLYIANQGNNTVVKCDPSGHPSVFATGLDSPDGLAFDSTGNLYVVNYLNNTITQLNPNGQGSLFASSGLYSPIFIAIKREAIPASAKTATIQITTIQAAIQNEVYLTSTNLLTGTNYQVQVSSNLTSWANSGSVFTATNCCWESTNSWMVPDHTRLFFRLLTAQ